MKKSTKNIVRTVKFSTKFTNKDKIDLYTKIFVDFKLDLQSYIEDIISGVLPFNFGGLLTSKLIPNKIIKHSQYKQIIYKTAIEIIKSNLVKTKNKTFKRYSKVYYKAHKRGRLTKFLSKKYSELDINFLQRLDKINVDNVGINLDSRLFDIEKSNDGLFSYFIKIKSPYIVKNKAITIKIPLKSYKYAKKFISDFSLNSTIQLKESTIGLVFSKELPDKKVIKNVVGLDVGYKKLLADNKGNFYGQSLLELYNKISNKVQGSKAFKRLLIHRNNEINRFCNKFLLDNVELSLLVLEKLKSVKSKSKGKIYKKVMNKMQRWSYPLVMTKLERLSETKGFSLHFVNPAYTSQQCSKCSIILKSNRNGETYKCNCGNNLDADTNAAINITRKGTVELNLI